MTRCARLVVSTFVHSPAFRRALLAAALIVVVLDTDGASQSAWAPQSPPPTARYAIAAAALNGVAHVVGGLGSADSGRGHDAYDPTMNTWTARAPMAVRRWHPAAAVLNNGIKDLLYVVGGSTGVGTRTDTMEAYDPDTDTWTMRAPMPGGQRSNMGAAVLNGLLYVAGGATCDFAFACITNVVEVYDPVNDRWLPNAAPMPHAQYSMSIGVIGGLLYVSAGGNTSSTNDAFRFVDAYDPVTDTWTSRAPAPRPRAFVETTVSNGRLWAIGGEAPFYASADVYDAASDTWISGPDLPRPMAEGAAVTIDGIVYVFGGFDGTTNTVYATTLAFDDRADAGPDTTPPITSAAPGAAPNADGWTRGPLTIQLTARDNIFGSGVASMTYSTTGADTQSATVAGSVASVILGSQGATTLVFHATDQAGNVEADRTLTFKVDPTPPSIAPVSNITQPATSSTGAFVNLAAPTAADSGSGLRSIACDRTSGFFPLGRTTVTCTAVDNVGNTSSAQFTVFVTAQPGYDLLTIHMVGLGVRPGDPPVSGAVDVIPKGDVCNSGGASTCTYQFPAGTSMKLTSNAPGGSTPGVFSAGTGDAAACATSTCTFVLNHDSEITATFDPNAPVVRLSIALAGDAGGEVGADNNRCQSYDYHPASLPTQGTACTTSYAPNSVAAIQAAPPAGTRFSGYADGTLGAAACGPSASCAFVLSGDTSVTGSFSALTSISVAPASASVLVNQSQPFTARGAYTDGTVNEAFPPGRMGTWTTKASMSQRRFDFAAAAAGGRVYAIAGLDGSGQGSSLLGSVEAYDPASNTWTPVHAMNARASLAAVAVGDRYIYAVGGDVSGACPVDTLEVYDTANDANGWSALPPMPGGPRRFLSAVAVGPVVYAIGGELNQCFQTSGVALNRVEAFDSSNGTWTTKAPMPTARRFFGAGVVHGVIYAVGGDDEHSNLATVEAYDPATDTWTSRAPLPDARSLLAVAAVDDVLYAVGGNNGGYFNTLFAYDAASDAWSNKVFIPQVEDLPFVANNILTNIDGQRGEAAAASLGGRLYTMGGLTSPGSISAIAVVTAFADHLTWSTTDASVARLGQSGQATGVHAGQATIEAHAGATSCEASGGCATLSVLNAPSNTTPAVTIFGPSSVTINTGSGISVNGSFRDPDSGQTWTASVSYGDNSGLQNLRLTLGADPLAPTGTFSLGHIYMNAGSYVATVTVTDNLGAHGSASLQVTVNANAGQIFLGLPNSVGTQVNNANWGCGSFIDTGGSGHWSGMIDYGDGSEVQPLLLNVPAPAPPSPCVPSSGTPPTGTFLFNHAYTAPSPVSGYPVSVRVINTDTHVSTTRGFPVTVQATIVSISVSPSPVTLSPGQNQMFQAVGHYSDGTTQTLTSFNNGLQWRSTNSSVANVDGSGNAVATGPGQTTIVATTSTGLSCAASNSCATLNVVDTQPPFLNIPSGDQTREATGPSGAVVSFFASAFDSIDGDRPVRCNPPPGSTFGFGTTTVTCSASDTSGNTATGSFTVTVRDTNPPFLGLPNSQTREANSPSGAIVTYFASANDSVDGPVPISCSPASGSPFGFGPTTVTCSASDSHGNTRTGSFTITVRDTTAPFLNVPSQPLTVTATSAAGAVVNLGQAVSAFDSVDGNVTPSCNPPSGSTFPIGSTTVSCQATDTHGNSSAMKTFTVTVNDRPVVHVPASVTAEATSAAGAAVSFTVTASDFRDGGLPVQCFLITGFVNNQPQIGSAVGSGAIFPLGTSTVGCIATSTTNTTNGNLFTITVVDTTPPTISGTPASFPIEATGPQGAVATYTPPSATDLVDGAVSVSCSPASGTLLGLGPHTVTCTAADAHGNAAAPASFVVTVRDTTPPSIASAVPSVASLWPPDHRMVPLTVSVAASDLVDAAPVCSITDVTSNEPVDGLGDGDTAPDWTIGSGLALSLRAERAGSGSGRVYTIKLTCTDHAGNTSAPTAVTVSVPHNR